MALGLDGFVNGSIGSSSASCVFPALTTTNGNVVVIVSFVSNDAGVASITNSGTALTWIKRASIDTNGTPHIAEWYAVSSSALSSTVITVNLTAAVGFAIGWAFGISGANTTSPFDTNASLPAVNTGPNGATISTTAANTFIIGAFRDLGTASPQPGTGFTQIGAVNYAITEYQIVSSAQSALSVNQRAGVGAGDANGVIVDAIVAASAATVITIDRPCSVEWRRASNIDTVAASEWKRAVLSDGVLPNDGTTGLQQSMVIPSGYYGSMQTNGVVPTEWGLSAQTTIASPAEWNINTQTVSATSLDWLSVLQWNTPAPTDFLSTARVDGIVPIETGSIRSTFVDTTYALEWKSTLTTDSTTRFEWLGMTGILADASVPIEWSSTLWANNTVALEAGLFFRSTVSAPVEAGAAVANSATIPLNMLASAQWDNLSPIEWLGISSTFVDGSFLLEWRTATQTDRTAPTDWRVAFASTYLVLSEFGMLRLSDMIAPGEMSAAGRFDTTVPMEWNGITATTADASFPVEWRTIAQTDRTAPAEWRFSTTRDYPAAFEVGALRLIDASAPAEITAIRRMDTLVFIEWNGITATYVDGSFPVDWRSVAQSDGTIPTGWRATLAVSAASSAEMLASTVCDIGFPSDRASLLRTDRVVLADWGGIAATFADASFALNWQSSFVLDSTNLIEWSRSAVFLCVSSSEWQAITSLAMVVPFDYLGTTHGFTVDNTLTLEFGQLVLRDIPVSFDWGLTGGIQRLTKGAAIQQAAGMHAPYAAATAQTIPVSPTAKGASTVAP